MTLTDERISALLQPYLPPGIPVPSTLYAQLGVYLDLLLRWNARTNLTSIRDPEEIVRRHFGESLFAGTHLEPHLPEASTLLDFGSGAGFPGLPIQILFPHLRVTLSESQGKKSAFLREVVRTLGLSSEVWADRVENMPSARRFDVVALRAVDKMDSALSEANKRIVAGGTLAVLAGKDFAQREVIVEARAIPGSVDSFLLSFLPIVFHVEHPGFRVEPADICLAAIRWPL